jgi:hypothetical protein
LRREKKMNEKNIQLLIEILKVLNTDVDYDLREIVKKILASELINIK